MAASIVLRDGTTYTGPTVWAIIRRVWGRSKFIVIYEPNEAMGIDYFEICVGCRHHFAQRRLAVADVIEGPWGKDNTGELWQGEASA